MPLEFDFLCEIFYNFYTILWKEVVCLFKIQIVDSLDTHSFYFESEQNYQKAIKMLKKECSGQSIQQTPCHFCFRTNSSIAAEKMAKFHAKNP